MRLALLQAQKSIGNTKENPSVGCIIVKDNTIIGAGSTGFNGRPHAEINAIKKSKINIANSILFTTLEPCSHYGKTPPCVNSIIKKKVKKVIFSILDPDIRTFKKSSIILKNKKIDVKNKILLNETKNFYKSYIISKSKKLPFVTAKIATSKDFYTKNTKNKWITNRSSRGRVHLIRSSHDAIITSSKTIKNDNSKLTCRINGLEKTSPSRFILDKNLTISLNSYILKNSNKFKTTIFYSKGTNKKLKKLSNMKIKLIKLPLLEKSNFDLKQVLLKIKFLGFSRILLEAGANLTKNFLDKNLINEFHLFISSKKIGSTGKLSFKKSIKMLKKNKYFKQNINLNGDKLITFIIK